MSHIESINETAAPCSLKLEVYTPISIYDDTETLDWEVSSDPSHEQPWLIAPRQYAEQEIDPIKCTASIGTIEVGVIDVPTVPGDQSTGWMTARIHDVKGRRCRLRRFIDDEIGWVIIADGPAGAPRMDASYAAYRWSIRDTRETERRLAAFQTGGVAAIIPRGSVYGFGEYTDDDGDHVLLPPVLEDPVTGTYQLFPAGDLVYGLVNFAPLHFTGLGHLTEPKLIMDTEGQSAVQLAELLTNTWGAQFADVLWRVQGDTLWNKARPTTPSSFRQPFVGTSEALLNGIGDPVLCANYVSLFIDANVPDGFPLTDGVIMEVVVRYRGPATEGFPYYVEGDLGDVLRDLYDGIYSIAPTFGIEGDTYDPAEQDSAGISLVTRVQYEPDAFDQMVEHVCLRQTSPVTDVRAFTETALYAPSGWIPALDNNMQISPVSRNAPTTVDASLVVDDGTAIPSPDWQTGERTLSSIVYSYPRFFAPDSASTFEFLPDGIASRPVTLTFTDANSEIRHGPQIEEFDASAFAAIGTEDGLNIPGQLEQASLLAQTARFELLDRYAAGVQTIGVTVLRSRIPFVRAGDWVPWSLLHLPDRLTGLRGSVATAAQVVSIRDDDCTWRKIMLEESQESEGPPGAFILLEKIDDEPSPGGFSFEVIDDTESGS